MNALAPMDRNDGAPIFGDEPAYREPPSNEDAEQALLGALLQSDALLDRLTDVVTGEDFYVPVHGRIFEAVQQVAASGRKADPVTLRAHFESDETLKDVGGAGYLARLVSVAAVPRTAIDYAREIADCALRRRLIDLTADASDAAWNAPGGEAQAEALEAQLFDLRRKDATGEASDAASAFDAMVSRAQAMSSGEVALIQTGIAELDRILIGLAPGDVMVVAARPAMGKTALSQAFTRHNTAQDIPVGVLQFEMSREQMMAREVSHITGIPTNPIQFGRLDPADWEAVARARGKIAKLPLFIDDRSGVHIDQVLPRLRRMVRRYGIRLAVIDYMGLIRFQSSRGRYEGLTEVSGRLKEAARTLGIPLIVLHQLSRANESREDKRPTLSDLRDSGAIEQDADKVLFIHRPEYYLERDEPDRDDLQAHLAWEKEIGPLRGRADLILAKHRQGATGTARCEFVRHTTTFRDYERGML